MAAKWKKPGFPDGKTLKSIGKAACLTAGFSYVFYRSWLGAVLFPVFAVWCIRQDRLVYTQKQQRILARQFTDTIQAVSGNLQAGYSIENAFLEAEKDICTLYGKDSQMAVELTRIRHGLHNRIPIEQLLLRFGNYSQVEEIQDFAEVFAVIKHSGGNLRAMIRRTVELTGQRQEVEEEITQILISRRFEMKIMNAIPFLMYVYLDLTSPGFFDVLYHNPAGVCVMTGCLAGYLAAVFLSVKIMDIQV